MKTHAVDSSYRQFYVADAGLDPDAPEVWRDEDVQQRFNALKISLRFAQKGILQLELAVYHLMKNI